MATPSKKEFQIGWICALRIEEAAAIQMLDDNFGILQEQETTDTNVYTLGRIGNHHVVISCLPEGKYGTTSATTVAINMTRTFSDSLRIGLMVGIAGGAPTVDHDIRLGDIVVSCPNDISSGVIQHDMRKIVKDGKTQRVGTLNSPPKLLLNAMAKMRSVKSYQDYKYPSYIHQAIEKDTETRKSFSRPNIQSDRLFKVQYTHAETATSCSQCPVEWEEERVIREKNNPQVHYGIIASGNTVIKDGKTREAIREETGALCFEMEAAGLMADFPCLVIRGICDYADSHKNKEWQGYAALAAAAYAKELLAYVPKGVSRERLVSDVYPIIEGINKDQKRAFDQRENHHREIMERAVAKDRRLCHQAFKTSTYEKFKNFNPDRVEGTCEWVLNSPEYLRWWEATNNDLLWVSADPGCGKSVLAKCLVDEIFKPSELNISTIHFFFKDNDEQNNLAIALCAVLHQLFDLQPQLLRHALPYWEKNQKMIQQEDDALWRIFIAAASDPASGKIICVFDALDECQRQDQKQLIKKLNKFQRDSHPSNEMNWLKFLITSRPYDEIESDFRPILKDFPQIHLRGEEENDQIRNEINLVMKVYMTNLSEKLRLTVETQTRLEICLSQIKHRTYLWLSLAIDDIHNTLGNSVRPEQEPIRLIPKTVNEAYKKILDRVTPDQEENVKMTLQIIIGARRPLTIREMAMALGIATARDVQTAEKACLNPDGLGERLRQWCGLFIFVRDSRIYLFHQTAREFLVGKYARSAASKWYLKPSLTNVQMTRICVRYLLMDDLVSNKADGIHVLLDYCGENWPHHFQKIKLPERELVQSAYKLYDLTTERFALWFPTFWRSTMPYFQRPQMNQIQLAAFTGHGNILSLLDTSENGAIDQTDSSDTNALQWACIRGNYGIVQQLLELGANVNAQGGHYGNALQAALIMGHPTIVLLLLEKGADVNAQSRDYGYALQIASAGGHLEIVQQLLKKGADVNSQGGYALQNASAGGHLEIVQLLLNERADVNAQDGYYGNALQAASAKGHLEIVQQLLEKGADVNSQGGYALQIASAGGHLEIVQLLLNERADVNAQDGYYGNALQAASAKGYLEIVQLLLGKGADINAQGGLYGNALYAACIEGHLEIIHLLETPRKYAGPSVQKRKILNTDAGPVHKKRRLNTYKG